MKFLLNFANALFVKPNILNGCERRNFDKQRCRFLKYCGENKEL